MEKKKFPKLRRLFVLLLLISIVCCMIFSVPAAAWSEGSDPGSVVYADFPFLFTGYNLTEDAYLNGVPLPQAISLSSLSSNNSQVVSQSADIFCAFSNFVLYNGSMIEYDIVPGSGQFGVERDGVIYFELGAPMIKRPTLQSFQLSLDDDFVVRGSASGYRLVVHDDAGSFSQEFVPVSYEFEQVFTAGDWFTFQLQTLPVQLDILSSLSFEIVPHASIVDVIYYRTTYSSDPSSVLPSFVDRFDVDIEKQITVNHTDLPDNWLDWLIDVAGGILNLEFVPGFSIGYMLAAILGVLVVWWLLHLFM